MEHIRQTAARMTASEQPSRPAEDAEQRLPDELIEHLFAEFDAIYPIRWRSAFRTPQACEDAMDRWARYLADMTREEIDRGIETARREFPDWPPSEGRFEKLCRPSRVPYYSTARPAPLPDPVETDFSRECLARLRRLVG